MQSKVKGKTQQHQIEINMTFKTPWNLCEHPGLKLNLRILISVALIRACKRLGT